MKLIALYLKYAALGSESTSVWISPSLNYGLIKDVSEVLPVQDKVSETKNENKFEHCRNHHFRLGFVHIHQTFYFVLVIINA